MIRLPLLVYFGIVLWKSMSLPEYESLLSGLNLGIHELGHVVFSPFGKWWGIAGGTILQLAFPLVSLLMFWRQRDYFAWTFSLAWLSTNLFGIARYVGDARAMQLPLVSPFAEPEEHDWNYLLWQAGALQYDRLIASWVRAAAIGCLALGLMWGGWVLWQMVRGSVPGRKGTRTAD